MGGLSKKVTQDYYNKMITTTRGGHSMSKFITIKLLTGARVHSYKLSEKTCSRTHLLPKPYYLHYKITKSIGS